MIKITQEGNNVKVMIDLGLNCQKSYLLFDDNFIYDYIAELVAKQINEQLRLRLQRIRKESYERGYKHGRSHFFKDVHFSGDFK